MLFSNLYATTSWQSAPTSIFLRFSSSSSISARTFWLICTMDATPSLSSSCEFDFEWWKILAVKICLKALHPVGILLRGKSCNGPPDTVQDEEAELCEVDLATSDLFKLFFILETCLFRWVCSTANSSKYPFMGVCFAYWKQKRKLHTAYMNG